MVIKVDASYEDEMKVFSIRVDEVGQGFDGYLVCVFNDVSRTSAQQVIIEGGVLVNGRPSKSGYVLRNGDEVQLLSLKPTNRLNNVKPQQISLDIVYEDPDLLVVNKPAGMVVHPAPGHHEDTLVNALLARYPDIQENATDQRPGIIHRLGKHTSGLIIVARNPATQPALE